jgi:hypothetical protein
VSGPSFKHDPVHLEPSFKLGPVNLKHSFKLGPINLKQSFKLGPSIMLLYNTSSTFLLHLPSANISSKSSLLLLQELPTGNLFFDRSRADLYSSLSSHQCCKFFFLFGLLIFAVKLKYANSRVYRSYCRDKNVADQCVSRRSNLENFNRHGLRYSCRVHIFCQQGNQSS